MDDHEESWDEDFELEDAHSSTGQSNTSLTMPGKEESSQDYQLPSLDDELKDTFDDVSLSIRLRTTSVNNFTRDNRKTVVGLEADLFEKEDWDQDMDIAGDDIEGKKLTLSRPSMELSSSLVAKSVENLRALDTKFASQNNLLATMNEEKEDDLEDWDKEMGFEDTADRKDLVNALQKELKSAPEVGFVQVGTVSIPSSHVLNTIEDANYVIRLPKAPQLFSMKMHNGTNKIPEIEVEKWILAVVEKHAPKRNVLETEAQMAKDLLSKEPFSSDWCKAILFECLQLYRKNLQDNCELLLLSLFEELVSYTAKKPFTNKEADLFVRLLAYHLKWKSFTAIQFTSSKEFEVIKKKNRFFALMIEIIHLEGKAHMRESPINQIELEYSSLYQTVLSKDNGLNSSEVNLLKLTILVDLQCLNFSLSPLTTDSLPGNNDADSDIESEMATVMHGLAMTHDPDFRLKEISKIYDLFPASFLKAKAAYVLSLVYFHELGDSLLSEKLAFESVFILDNIASEAQNAPPILSTLGYNALRLFGEVLVTNQKIAYAIPCFEAALQNLSVRNKKVSFNQLSSVGSICLEGGQLQRSIKFYYDALVHVQKEQKINEAVHLALMLADLLVCEGNIGIVAKLMNDTVQYLQNLILDAASKISLLALDARAMSNISTSIAKLRLHMANIYLKAGLVDKAVVLVETCVEEGTVGGYLWKVVLYLARCYQEKLWTKESLELLRLFKHIKSDDKIDAILNSMEQSSSFEFQRVMAKIKEQMQFSLVVDVQELQGKLDSYKALSHCLVDAGMIQEAILVHSKWAEEPVMDLKQQAKMLSFKGKIIGRFSYPSADVEALMHIKSSGLKGTLSMLPKITNRRSSSSVKDKQNVSESNVRTKQISRPSEIGKTDEQVVCSSYVDFQKAELIYLTLGLNDKAMKCKLRRISCIADFIFNGVVLSKQTVKDVLDKIDQTGLLSKNMLVDDLILPTIECVEHFARTKCIISLAQSYIVLSEIYRLNDKADLSVAYWTCCRDLLWNSIIDGSNCPLINELPESKAYTIKGVLKRLARHLIASRDYHFLKANIMVLDAFIQADISYNSVARSTLSDTIMQGRRRMSKGMKRSESKSSKNNSALAAETTDFDSIGSKLRASKSSLLHAPQTDNFQTYPPPSSSKFGSRVLDFRLPENLVSSTITADGSSSHCTESESQSIVSSESDDVRFDSHGLNSKTNSKNHAEIARTINNILGLSLSRSFTLKLFERKSSLEKLSNEMLSSNFSSWLNEFDVYRSINAKIWAKTNSRVEQSQKFGKQSVYSFDDLAEASNSVGHVLYIVQLDDFIAFVSPKIGLMTWQRMVHPLATQSSSTLSKKDKSVRVRIPDSMNENGAGDSNKSEKAVCLRINFAKTDTFAILEVSVKSTLHDCIKCLYKAQPKKTLEKTVSSSSTKSLNAAQTEKFSGSKKDLNVDSQKEQELMPKVLEMSPTLRKILESSADALILANEQNCFANRIKIGEKIVFEKLDISTDTPISETSLMDVMPRKGASQETPFNLFWVPIYDVTTESLMKEESALLRRQQESQFVLHMLEDTKDDLGESGNLSSSKWQQTIRDMRLHTFPRLQAALLQLFSESETKSPTTRKDNRMDKMITPLICSVAYQAYPWELILRTGHIIRSFSITAAAFSSLNINSDDSAWTMMPPRNRLKEHNARFLTAYYGDETSPFLKADKSRKHKVGIDAVNLLNGNRLIRKPISQQDQCVQYPMHCPLISQPKKISSYKRRYKYFKFLDLTTADAHKSSPSSLVSGYSSQFYPVFFFTLGDLYEMNNWTLEALQSNTWSTIVFVPPAFSKAVALKLKDLMDDSKTYTVSKKHNQPLSSSTTSSTTTSASLERSNSRSIHDDSNSQDVSTLINDGLMSKKEQMFWRLYMRQAIHGIEQSLDIPLPLFETPSL